jgi:hypothetical protein
MPEESGTSEGNVDHGKEVTLHQEAILPTTREIAKLGASEFSEFFKKLSPQSQEKLMTNVAIRRCFTGVSPEVRFEQPSRNSFAEEHTEYYERARDSYAQTRLALIEANKLLPADYIMMYFPAQEEKENEMFIMLNIRAVQRVMTIHPDHFPLEVKAHPKEWLQSNFKEWWDGNNMRYGLISGFPPEAIRKFINGEREESVGSDKLELGFIGDPKRDGPFITALENIYEESGIQK